jgi:tetratricopeptide (TPR) repeat protein
MLADLTIGGPNFRKVIPIAALAAIALAGCTSTRSSTPSAKAEIDTSSASQVNISSLSSVVDQNPADAGAYNVRGTAFGKAGKLNEALADFDKAIQINPGFYQAYANRALIHRRKNQDDRALADYNQAIQLNQSYDVAYIGRGNIYRQRKQLDAALADFNRAIELDTADPRAFHNRGLVYQAMGQQQLAIQDFSTAISRAPTAIEPYNARGLAYLATADYRAALDDFNEVVKRDKNSYEGWTNQALALEKLGEPGKAFNAFARASTLNPNYRPAKDGMKRTLADRSPIRAEVSVGGDERGINPPPFKFHPHLKVARGERKFVLLEAGDSLAANSTKLIQRLGYQGRTVRFRTSFKPISRTRQPARHKEAFKPRNTLAQRAIRTKRIVEETPRARKRS